MQLNSFNGWQALLITLLFIVTGYITHSVAVRFAPRRSERIELLLLRFLAYGTANAFLVFPLIVWQTRLSANLSWYTFVRDNAAAYYFLALSVLFATPLCLGIVIGLFILGDGPFELYRGSSTWDEKLTRTYNKFVIVTLEDGKKVLGFFDGKSSVFTESANKDLFLGVIYKQDKDGQWQKVERTAGMLIQGNAIRSIEFWYGRPEINEKGWFAQLKAQYEARHIERTPPDCDSSVVSSKEQEAEAQNENLLIWPHTGTNGTTNNAPTNLQQRRK